MNLEEYLNNNNKDIIDLSNRVVELENALSESKKLEDELKKVKENLKQCMQEKGISKWITTNGVQITLVPDKEDEEELKENFDLANFMLENKELVEQYNETRKKYVTMETVIVKGKKGYLRITLPKENKDEKGI